MSKFDACGSDAFVFAREQGNSSTGRLRGVVGRAAGANKERSAYGSNLWHNPVAFVSPGAGNSSEELNREKKPTARKQHLERSDHFDAWHEHTRSASAVPPQTAFLEDDDPHRIYPADSNPHGRARPNLNGKMREIRTELAEEESRRQHERDLLANTRTSLLYSNSPTDTMLQYGQYIVGGRARNHDPDVFGDIVSGELPYHTQQTVAGLHGAAAARAFAENGEPSHAIK
eukprot:g12017.t1